MSKHTSEPWMICRSQSDLIEVGQLNYETQVALIEADGGDAETDAANAARIVECVNACAGYADPSKLRDVVEAGKQMLEALENGWSAFEPADNLEAALAALEGRDDG